MQPQVENLFISAGTLNRHQPLHVLAVTPLESLSTGGQPGHGILQLGNMTQLDVAPTYVQVQQSVIVHGFEKLRSHFAELFVGLQEQDQGQVEIGPFDRGAAFFVQGHGENQRFAFFGGQIQRFAALIGDTQSRPVVILSIEHTEREP